MHGNRLPLNRILIISIFAVWPLVWMTSCSGYYQTVTYSAVEGKGRIIRCLKNNKDSLSDSYKAYAEKKKAKKSATPEESVELD